MQKLTRLLLPAIISIFFLPNLCKAQDTTSMGTVFWVGYGHHQFMETGSNTQAMTLYFSTDSLPAVVTVTIDSSGASPTLWWRRVYNIPANTVVSVDNYPATSYTTVAGISGPIPKSGAADARLFSDPQPLGTSSSGLFRKKGIHIQSDVPIGVHSHIYGSTSSGASLLLPVRAWGYTYTSINSKQQYAANTFSWMYVIAKEDSTVIEITPSVLTRAQNKTGLQPGVPSVITLHKGQIYQVMGANDAADANGNGGTSSAGKELTGTKVRALVKGKPVAVFSGSSRTSNTASCGSGGGDNDMVQLFPLHIWGTRYLTAPTPGSNGASSFATNTFKIVVNDPVTVVKRNGVVMTGLVNSNYYTFESNTTEYIEADKPILLAQFMTGGGGCMTGSLGDPDMYYLSPIDAGIKTARTMRSTREAITINYLLLIVPTTGLPSLKIDSANVFDHAYAHGKLPGYTVVVKRWTAANAQVNISCDSAFTGIAYGLGSLESYGFNVGAKFNPLHGVDPMYRMRWKGTMNTDWTVGTNWSTGFVPTSEDHVVIDAGTPNNLVIPDGVEVSCKTLELSPGAVMTVKPSAKLNVRQ